MKVWVLALLAATGVASGAAAQLAVGNPPGNTLAPATGNVAPPAPPTPAPVGDMVAAGTPKALAAQKYKTDIVCRTSVVTGSLIARKKTCLTRAQWQYVNDENQRDAYKFVQDNTTKSGSN